MKNQSEVFMYDNIRFENGHKDVNEHPVIVAGNDDQYLYCFAMTSQTKHTGQYSPERNKYNENIKYAKTIPNKNIRINNNKEGLVNACHCFTIRIEDARFYSNLGFATKQLMEEIKTKWVFHQTVVKEKPDRDYIQKCDAMGINEAIVKSSEYYKYLTDFSKNIPKEIQIQRQYYKELDAYVARGKENNYRRKNNMPLLPYLPEPKLRNDKSWLDQYSKPQQDDNINPAFAALYQEMYGEEEKKQEVQPPQKSDEQIKAEIYALRDQLREAIAMKQSSQTYSEDYEEEKGFGRRAA